MNSSKIAQLSNAIRDARRDEEEAQEQIRIWQVKRTRARQKAASLQKQLDARDKKSVTDHAIVRYMERAMGIDIEDLRKTIAEDPSVHKKIKNGVIVTVDKK